MRWAFDPTERVVRSLVTTEAPKILGAPESGPSDEGKTVDPTALTPSEGAVTNRVTNGSPAFRIPARGSNASAGILLFPPDQLVRSGTS